jgi:hypothetical protein
VVVLIRTATSGDIDGSRFSAALDAAIATSGGPPYPAFTARQKKPGSIIRDPPAKKNDQSNAR